MVVLASRGVCVRSWPCTFSTSELATSLECLGHMNNSEHETEGGPDNQHNWVYDKRGRFDIQFYEETAGFQGGIIDGTTIHISLKGFELELNMAGFARRNALMR